ncbi:hypothetical protein LNQ81_02205 [Myroides sp. M-43]|uniref:hypothetical protein n=1 Tax=Myroides oncorhynchi TaxID=2893756 RepID=UPI001E503C22|nr:hypothetical protein [Myroides oncorhynchi]MCC9041529.1 hypothetical protein [Myroides oncorhynchi]
MGWIIFIVLLVGAYLLYKKNTDRKCKSVKQFKLVSEELLTVSLEHSEVRQHRYHYDGVRDNTAFLNKDFRYSLSEKRAGIDSVWIQNKITTSYDLIQNRINYIESLELYEVRIPVFFDGKEMKAVSAMEIDRSTLKIHLFNEKDVKILVQKYETKQGEVKYDCIFGFDFLLSDEKYKSMYISTYMLYSNIS